MQKGIWAASTGAISTNITNGVIEADEDEMPVDMKAMEIWTRP